MAFQICNNHVGVKGTQTHMAWFTQNTGAFFIYCPIETWTLPLKDNRSGPGQWQHHFWGPPTANQSTAPGASPELPSGAAARDLNMGRWPGSCRKPAGSFGGCRFLSSTSRNNMKRIALLKVLYDQDPIESILALF